MANVRDRHRRVVHGTYRLLILIGVERERQATVEEAERRLHQTGELTLALVLRPSEVIVLHVSEKRHADLVVLRQLDLNGRRAVFLLKITRKLGALELRRVAFYFKPSDGGGDRLGRDLALGHAAKHVGECRVGRKE